MNDDRVVGKPVWNRLDLEGPLDQQFDAVKAILQVEDNELRKDLFQHFFEMNEYFDGPELWDFDSPEYGEYEL